MIDLIGKSDRVIARGEMRAVGQGIYALKEFYPGHMKWDYRYSIGELRPDVVAQLWLYPEEAELYLQDYERVRVEGFDLFIRRDSPRIRWDILEGG